MRWLLTFLLAVVVLATLAVPAQAAVIRGTTAQGEQATIRTDGAGVPTRFWLKKYTAPCRGGGFFRDRGAGAIEPLDVARPERLVDVGPEYESRDGALRFSILTSVRARLVAADRWKGRFKSRIEVRRRGELTTTCRTAFGFSARLQTGAR